MAFRQLAFSSRARLGLRASQTSELIATSRSNNARDDITGVMLYTGDSFVQIVEGSEAAIASLWRRLILDDRHRELTTLFDHTGDRWYVDWRAGYVAEARLAPLLAQWVPQSPTLAVDHIAQLRELCESTATF